MSTPVFPVDPQTFLLTLSDRLRSIADPIQLLYVALETVGQHLRVNRVGYCDIEDANGTLFYPVGWADGVLEPLAGRLPMTVLLGDAYIAHFRAGHTAYVPDVDLDPKLRPGSFAAIGTKALLAVPLVRAGVWVAGLFINQAEVRDWTPEEGALLEGVLIRTWEAVERARAETNRQRSESRQALLYELIKAQRNASEVQAVLHVAAESVGRFLEADRTGFFDMQDADTLAFTEGWAGMRLPLLEGIFPAAGLGPAALAKVRGGGTLVVENVDTDPVVAGSAFSEIGVVAVLGAPVLRDGRWLTGLYVHQAEPRLWLADEIGLICEVAEITWDAVERLRAQAALKDANTNLERRVAVARADLEAINDTLQQRIDKALADQAATEEALRQSQKLEAIGQLTGGVAHDFNNLLTIIKSAIELLQRPSLAEERRARYVEAIAGAVDRAAKLTSQLLAFARRQALKPEVFAACDGVRSIADMLSTITGARIALTTELPEQRCFVNADPSQFDTALVNMAVNARDAMDGEGCLSLRVAAVESMPPIRAQAAVSGTFVMISLTDTGSGIAPDKLEQIFEPFFTTKEIGKGTGLGLSQVFGFAKQSGGEVMVESEVGKGTTFTLYLPRVPEDARKTAHVSDLDTLLTGHNTCVLVVEDNVDVGGFSVQALIELGYLPILAINAHEALAELAKDAERFDVVFSDVVMPGMSGIDLARKLRREHPDLPVVLSSGYSHVLAQEGTYGFELLHKPYSVEELSRVLRKATLSRGRPASEDARTNAR